VGITSKNLEAYKKGYRLYASIIRKEFPQARLTWSPNGGNHTDVSIDEQWPGDDVVDVIGPDILRLRPRPDHHASSWQTESTAWLTPQSPTGLEAWLGLRGPAGKPFAMPEWGFWPAASPNPVWIRSVHDVLAAHAAPRGSRNVAQGGSRTVTLQRRVWRSSAPPRAEHPGCGRPTPRIQLGFLDSRWPRSWFSAPAFR